MRFLPLSIILALAFMPAMAGELPLPVAAKLLAIIAKSSNDGPRVACKQAEMAAELGKLGIEINASAKVTWAGPGEEVRVLAMQRRCVVTGDPKGLTAGAAVAVFEDGGKPKIMVNGKNLQSSGVTLSDQIMKAAAQ